MGALPRLPATRAMGQVKTGLPPPGVTPAPADSIAPSGPGFPHQEAVSLIMLTLFMELYYSVDTVYVMDIQRVIA